MRAINKQSTDFLCWRCGEESHIGKIVLTGASIEEQAWACDDCVQAIYGGQFDPDLQSDAYQLSFGV